MTRIALDSNILAYAELEPESAKGRRAAEVIIASARDGVVPVQVLGEFLHIVQRRLPAALEGAVSQVAIYRALFLTPATTDAVMADAAGFVQIHRLQVWDGVICAAALQQNAAILLTEDLQDGGRIGRLRLLNPFADENIRKVDAALCG